MFAENVVFSIFLIFTGAAFIATLVLFTRQSLLVAYMLLGVIIGPWGLKLITDTSLIKQIGEVGIIFLLFLLGLHLQPQNLFNMLRKTTVVAAISSLVFFAVGVGIGMLCHFTLTASMVIGAAMMFSSTIIGLKLLPTTILHHQHTGEVMISVLLMQDVIAIIVLLLLNGAQGGLSWFEFARIVIGMPLVTGGAFLFERLVLVKLFTRFDRIQEYIFLVSIGWCLGLAELTHWIGLSTEFGAFVAGVALAEGPIALYIAESLKPLRDFFLVMFFFAIGASFNLDYLGEVIKPALAMGIILLLIKPIIFSVLLRWTGEAKKVSWEVGLRLGQASEFSLLVAYIAANSQTMLIDDTVSYLIQATTILTFIVSSYIIVWRYPTPLAISDRMRRD